MIIESQPGCFSGEARSKEWIITRSIVVVPTHSVQICALAAKDPKVVDVAAIAVYGAGG